MHPNLPIENLTNDISLLISSDPRFILIALSYRGRIDQGIAGGVFGRCVFRVGEELPGAEVAMVHPVEDNTHAFPSCDQGGDAEDKSDDRDDSVGTAC